MKKDYLKPQLILMALSEDDAIRTSSETDNWSAWSENWSNGIKGGNQG